MHSPDNCLYVYYSHIRLLCSELMDTDSQEKKNVYLPGRPGLSEKEAAEILIIEARSFLLVCRCSSHNCCSAHRKLLFYSETSKWNYLPNGINLPDSIL